MSTPTILTDCSRTFAALTQLSTALESLAGNRINIELTDAMPGAEEPTVSSGGITDQFAVAEVHGTSIHLHAVRLDERGKPERNALDSRRADTRVVKRVLRSAPLSSVTCTHCRSHLQRAGVKL